MKDLIEALTIFAKYTDSKYPTNCSNHALCVDVGEEAISDKDKARLEELSFEYNHISGTYYSLRFGSY